jgi:hypothetical protein
MADAGPQGNPHPTLPAWATKTGPVVHPLLFYTSHSPIQVGQRECSYARWLSYHAGPHGTGYRTRRTAIPLATGGAVHKGVELLLKWVLDFQQAHPHQRLLEAPREVIAWAAVEAAERYEERATQKGLEVSLGDVQAEYAVAQLVKEQKTLVEGLVWIYAIARLPVMLASYRLIAAEFEETPVVDCTCGLGDWLGNAAVHAQRGCAGTVFMGKTDSLWEAVSDIVWGETRVAQGTIVYEEVKTKGQERKSWEDAWEHAQQLFLNMQAASKRIGRPVTQAYVPQLFKGWRGRDKGAPPTEPKYQHSPLCYGWWDAGNPPIREASYSTRYRWKDELGKTHQLPGTYKKFWVHDESVDLPWGPNVNLQHVPKDATRVERWVTSHILPEQWPDLTKTIGPFPMPGGQVPLYDLSVRVEERMWRRRLEVLRDAGATDPQHALVDQVIPRSWNCTRYDGTPCFAKPICNREEGWNAIESHPRYERRRPHHAPELRAFEALGVDFPPSDFDDEADDEAAD